MLAALFGALLVVSLGTALQFREIATSATELLGPDARLLETAAEMQRLLGAPERGVAFEQAFRAQLDQLDDAQTTAAEQALAAELHARFAQLLESIAEGGDVRSDERLVAEGVAALTARVGREATTSADAVASQAMTAAVGLSVLSMLTLVLGGGALRTTRRGFLRRLIELDQAAIDICQGDEARRVAPEGDDELARLAKALNFALDARDRCDAAMHGRNRELRALLVALLRRWPTPAAITGIDGDVLASTLSGDAEQQLHSLAPQVRKAAGILLSRGFVSASELETDVSFAGGDVVRIRALALGEQRVVGWLAEFEDPSKKVRPVSAAQGAHSSSAEPPPSPPSDDTTPARPDELR
jgi:hypothetical protein